MGTLGVNVSRLQEAPMADALQPYREALAKRVHTVYWDRNLNPDSPIDTEAACRIERFLSHLVKAAEFFARHLGRWVFHCLEEIKQKAHSRFYRALADSLAEFLRCERAALETAFPSTTAKRAW